MSDWKTIIVPQSIFAIIVVLAGLGLTPAVFSEVLHRLPHMLAWLWLHLFVTDLVRISISLFVLSLLLRLSHLKA